MEDEFQAELFMYSFRQFSASVVRFTKELFTKSENRYVWQSFKGDELGSKLHVPMHMAEAVDRDD